MEKFQHMLVEINVATALQCVDTWMGAVGSRTRIGTLCLGFRPHISSLSFQIAFSGLLDFGRRCFVGRSATSEV